MRTVCFFAFLLVAIGCHRQQQVAIELQEPAEKSAMPPKITVLPPVEHTRAIVTPTPEPPLSPFERYGDAMTVARKSGKKVLVIVTKKDCEHCQRLKKELADPDVKAALSRIIRLYVDADDDVAFLNCGDAMPAYVLIRADTTVIRRGTGYKSGDEFLAWLRGEVTREALVFEEVSGATLLETLPKDDEAKPEFWPKRVPFLAGLRPFQRARYTQRIATTNNTPSVTGMPRTSTLAKWQVSGGMEHLSKHLWKSDVFKLIPGGAPEYIARLPVFNGSNDQYELGYARNYPDGTVFMDVLSNRETGKVFEHRVAEKKDGAWKRYVAFRDPEQRPEGYKSLLAQGLNCASCHNRQDGPGRGLYAGPLVPGADTIVSDPFPQVEQGRFTYLR